jgi:RNA polymerase sigma factor (sigma-70 family)
VDTPITVTQPPSAEHTRWFAEEVHVHDVQLKAYLRGTFPAIRNEVDDVVQESYLRIWKVRAVQPIQFSRAFLFKVAHHASLDFLRHRQVSPIVTVPDLSALPVIENRTDAAETACSREEIILLAHALNSLPARCREIIILRKFQSIPQKEVGAKLGISELTVQEQVYRGVKRCAKFLVKRGMINPWRDE